MKINNNHFELGAVLVNETFELKGEMEKQSERDGNILQIETTVVESKKIDETNEDCLEKEIFFIRSDALEKSSTTENNGKVKDHNPSELTVKGDDVSLDEVVIEKKADWNSLYIEYVDLVSGG